MNRIEQILREQLVELEKLLDLKNKRIAELELAALTNKSNVLFLPHTKNDSLKSGDNNGNN